MTCVARIEGVCAGRADHRHHRRLRSQGGTDDGANLLAVCFSCHEHIHRHPWWARSWGLLVPSWQDPAEVPAVPAGVPEAEGPVT